MNMFSMLLITGLLILGFFLVVDSAIYLFENTGDRGESRRNRRLLARAQKSEKRIESVARDEIKPAATQIGNMLNELLTASGSNLPRERIFLAMGLVAAASFIAFVVFARWLPVPLQLALSLVIGFIAPILHLKNQATVRRKKFTEQFPEVLDLIVRSLRIGHPLGASLRMVAADLPAPAGPEFEIAARQVTYGRSTAEAIEALAERIDTPDVRFFSVAVQIHNEAGGNLGEILAGLASIIRSRFQLFRKIKALTAEGRFSAYFLSGFPLFMIFGMNALQPDYYAQVADFAYFPHLIAATITLLIINVIAMRLITTIEV